MPGVGFLDELYYGTKKPLRFRAISSYSGDKLFNRPFEGIIKLLENRYEYTSSDAMKDKIEQYMTEETCKTCHGARLKPEVLSVKIADKNISEVTNLSIHDALTFMEEVHVEGQDKVIAAPILKEIRERLSFLDHVGLVDIGEKMHLDLENAVSATCLATPAFDIEGKTTFFISAHLGFRKFCKEIADEVEDTRIGRGIGSRGASDRRLIDLDDFVDGFDALDRVVFARQHLRTLDGTRKYRVENPVDETRFSGSGDARHERQDTRRNLDVDVFEIVLSGTAQNDFPRGRSANFGDGNFLPA